MAASYRTAVIREVTGALKKTLAVHPDATFRTALVGPDFQYVKESYPAILISFTEREVKNIGIAHYSFKVNSTTGKNNVFGQWSFLGALTFTCMALSAFERDLLGDALIDIVAFGRFSTTLNIFDQEITDNDFIRMVIARDNAFPGGVTQVAAPWGTSNDQLYSINYTFNIYGEFFSDPQANTLVRLSAVNTFPHRPDQAQPIGTVDAAPWP